MAKLPTAFLDLTTAAATEHGVELHVLPDGQGLLLFAQGLTSAEQRLLLKQKNSELRSDQAAADPVEKPAENPGPTGTNSNIDCQVSVEERAQLFKFLSG